MKITRARPRKTHLIFDAQGKKIYEPTLSELDTYLESYPPEEWCEILRELRNPVSRNIDINLRIKLLDN